MLSFYNNRDEIIKNLIEIYNFIGPKGILILLGVRITNFTRDELLPNKESLIKEFNKKYNEKSKITVGARAVTKHADRNKNNNKFWGVVKGSEEERNINASLICLEMLANSVWISIFNLGSNVKILEIRNKEGFGLRWDYSNNSKPFFKGVVEPQGNHLNSGSADNNNKNSNMNKNDNENNNSPKSEKNLTLSKKSSKSSNKSFGIKNKSRNRSKKSKKSNGS